MTSTARTAATDRADAIGAAGATRAADAARAKEQRVTPELVIRELRTHDFGILSTVGAEGKPFSAGVNYGVGQTDAGLAIYVMTRRHLRKARNIAGNPHISLVVPLPRRVLWFLPPATIQLTGKTEILDWADRAGTEVFGRFWMGRRILEAYEKSRRRGETRVCFLRITPDPVVHTYMVGSGVWELRRRMESAAATVAIGPARIGGRRIAAADRHDVTAVDRVDRRGAAVGSADEACPVCMGVLESRRGWAIRRHGRWIHFRTRQCLDEFERRPEAYTGTDADEYPKAHPSPCSEWACY